jgi:hypothetical protein
MVSTTTKTDEREQWRARILRALAELQTDAASIDDGPLGEDRDPEGYGSSASPEV